jgi:hypothetical protein
MRNAPLESAIRAMDVAPHRDLSDAELRRANARLHQIVAEIPDLAQNRKPVWPWKRIVRWAVVPVAVGLVTATIVLLPSSGNSGAAFASWTPTPTAASASEEAAASEACLAVAGSMSSPAVVLAERRGDWVGLAYTTTEELFAMCVVHLPAGSDSADQATFGAASEADAVPVDGEFAEGPMSVHKERGLLGQFVPIDSPEYVFTSGVVGDDVSALTIHTADGLAVEATVQNGRYIAWFPGDGGASGDSAPVMRYDVTLADGGIVEDAIPILP